MGFVAENLGTLLGRGGLARDYDSCISYEHERKPRDGKRNRSSPGLSLPVSLSEDSETLVEVAGIEPETPCAKSPVSMQDSDFSPEALTEILTEISGTDRQMLSQIVKRWGSLSNELKRAVLRLVG